MEDELKSKVLHLANLLEEWKGEVTVALHLQPSVSWAQYCLISTCNSITHIRGILANLRDALRDQKLFQENIFSMPRYLKKEDIAPQTNWHIVDLGPVILHLMSHEARKFYELEELWPVAEIIYPPDRNNMQ